MKPRLIDTRLRIHVTPQVRELLALLVRTGLYGHTEEEAADRLLCRALEQRFPSQVDAFAHRVRR